MTREEVKAMLNEIGVKAEELSERAIEKIQEKSIQKKKNWTQKLGAKCANSGLLFLSLRSVSASVPGIFSFNL